MTESRQWRDVPVGSYIVVKGVVWRVDEISLDGSFRLWRPDRDAVTGRPPLSEPVEIKQFPEATDEAQPLETLRTLLGITIIECAWCNRTDEGSRCMCDEHCGSSRCVNFVKGM